MNNFEFEFVCDQEWDAMDGDGPVRFCGECERHVYNISELDVSTAARVADDPSECVRVQTRADGRVLQANGVLWGMLLPAAIVAGCIGEPAESVPRVISVEAPVAKLEIIPLEPVKTVDPALRRPDRSTRVTFDEAMARAGSVQSDRNAREGSFYAACAEAESGRDPLLLTDLNRRLTDVQHARDQRTGTENPVSKRTLEGVLSELEVIQMGRRARVAGDNRERKPVIVIDRAR